MIVLKHPNGVHPNIQSSTQASSSFQAKHYGFRSHLQKLRGVWRPHRKLLCGRRVRPRLSLAALAAVGQGRAARRAARKALGAAASVNLRRCPERFVSHSLVVEASEVGHHGVDKILCIAAGVDETGARRGTRVAHLRGELRLAWICIQIHQQGRSTVVRCRLQASATMQQRLLRVYHVVVVVSVVSVELARLRLRLRLLLRL